MLNNHLFLPIVRGHNTQKNVRFPIVEAENCLLCRLCTTPYPWTTQGSPGYQGSRQTVHPLGGWWRSLWGCVHNLCLRQKDPEFLHKFARLQSIAWKGLKIEKKIVETGALLQCAHHVLT